MRQRQSENGDNVQGQGGSISIAVGEGDSTSLLSSSRIQCKFHKSQFALRVFSEL